jgi:hypothetical protein
MTRPAGGAARGVRVGGSVVGLALATAMLLAHRLTGGSR